jgi:anti-anti-sigma factor
MSDMDCRVDRERLGCAEVLRVVGSIDMFTAPCLVSSLSACLAEKPTAIVVDLSKTDFFASAGMSALLDACEQACDLGIGFAVVADSAAAARPIRLLGIDKALNLHDVMDDAIASVLPK